ncbi:uncharacterized protein CTRU02_202595 [Colletotrichum truncatum]|uniref:Uncharacterized protein n=1 Tax=Colletotrichum truncatum TaxID=5467 RepID=A0ACC3ZKS0_COLTU|nr:uncharacterized protein CTRU02_01764 [Colletotrichum truncatum]KAF6800085.1 hypothetical protein CTRU02_01764 [Colletotrichum truncatum]
MVSLSESQNLASVFNHFQTCLDRSTHSRISSHLRTSNMTGPTTKQAFQSQSIGHWLPKDRKMISQWVSQKARQALQSPGKGLGKLPSLGPGLPSAGSGIPYLDSSLTEFAELVINSPHLFMLGNNMFTEASNHYPKDPAGNCAIKSFNEFISVLSLVVQSGPEFVDKTDPPTAMGLIGFPINAILDWPMGTESGYQFFRNPEVNLALGKVLSTWGEFLGSLASQACLDGWLSSDALEMIAAKGNNGKTDYTFQELFKCSPSEKHFGFKSWDEFFVRQFRDGVRPVEAPDNGVPDLKFPDPTLVITNACESAPLKIQTDVKESDKFWLKEQPYSLENMLNYDPLVPQFAGGTVYQAFLSALSYHRWHSPVSGKIERIEHVPGTYYSENWYEGVAGAENPDQADPAAPNYSQPYISSVATRMIMFIQADNPKIGLMSIVFIGMAEVSSCEAVVKPGDKVEKGQELGMFHFGGSSHCLVFRPEVNIKMVNPGPWDMDHETNFPVNSALAVVV